MVATSARPGPGRLSRAETERRQAIRPKADEIVSLTVEQIQKKYNVGSRWASAMKKNASRETINTAEVSTNQKQVIMEMLHRNGQAKNIAELRQWLSRSRPDLQAHSLVHVVWAMQKDGHVRFRERKNTPVGSEGSLERIQLSPGGKAEARRRFPTTRIDPSPVIDRAPTNGRTPEPAPQNQKSFIDKSATPQEGASMSASTSSTDGSGNTHTQYPDRNRYPMITTLMGRAEQISRYQQAAKLLEDDADLAVAILDKIKVTPLEEEVVRFVSETKNVERFGMRRD